MAAGGEGEGKDYYYSKVGIVPSGIEEAQPVATPRVAVVSLVSAVIS